MSLNVCPCGRYARESKDVCSFCEKDAELAAARDDAKRWEQQARLSMDNEFRLSAEAQRLRGALEEIAANCEWLPNEAHECAVWEHKRARAALTPSPENYTRTGTQTPETGESTPDRVRDWPDEVEALNQAHAAANKQLPNGEPVDRMLIKDGFMTAYDWLSQRVQARGKRRCAISR